MGSFRWHLRSWQFVAAKRMALTIASRVQEGHSSALVHGCCRSVCGCCWQRRPACCVLCWHCILRASRVTAEEDAPEGDIRTSEDLALEFYRLAEKGGDEEATIMLNEVRRKGRSALYFVSIEHLFNQQGPRVTHPERFYRPIKKRTLSQP